MPKAKITKKDLEVHVEQQTAQLEQAEDACQEWARDYISLLNERNATRAELSASRAENAALKQKKEILEAKEFEDMGVIAKLGDTLATSMDQTLFLINGLKTIVSYGGGSVQRTRTIANSLLGEFVAEDAV